MLTLEQALAYQPPVFFKEPVFHRHHVAKILNCTVLTLRNREVTGKYPAAERNPKNNYRIYSFGDVCRLQYITFGQVCLSPIVSVLYDMGYTDIQTLDNYISARLEIFKSTLNSNLNETKGEDQETIVSVN